MFHEIKKIHYIKQEIQVIHLVHVQLIMLTLKKYGIKL